jgi:hypothetical protein
MANQKNMSLAEFIRSAVDAISNGSKVSTAEEIATLYNLAEQIRRVGVNLNSLLAKLNSGQDVGNLPSKVEGTIDILQPLLNDTRKLIRRSMGSE